MFRRNFLKNMGLAGMVSMLPSALSNAAPVAPGEELTDLSSIELRGQVRAGGKGIKGVSVTDGTNVCQTDANGNYELLSNRQARFVYISVPSGYKFDNNQGIAVFYKVIPVTATSSFRADFSLEKLKQDDTQHNFVVWADPQIISKKDAELLLTQSAPDLRNLVDSYPKGSLFHGIGCGDLVWDHFELFEDYKKAIALSGIPFFSLIGNHDMDLNARGDEGSSVTFQQHFGPTYYSYNRGKIHYVVLDDVFFIGVAKKYIGYITEKQLRWLEQDLKTVKPGSTLVVSLHIPTNTGSRRRNKLKEDEMGGVVMNRQQLYDILKPYKVHIMSGHTHFNEVWTEANITEHVHGTVCGAWWTGPVCGDGTPNGYAVYEVNDTDISWYYKATGLPPEHQIRIYPPGKHPDYTQEISINVWNWDRDWKVEVFADDQNLGSPEQRVTYDPLALELHLGPDKPVKHKWVEPILTDHMFFVKVPVNTKSVKVNAIDGFGKSYKAVLSL